MKYSEFEHHIKSEFYKETSFVDTNTLINSIHSVNNSKKRKKLFIILLLFILALAIPFGLHNINNDSRKKNILPNIENNKSQKSNIIKQQVSPIKTKANKTKNSIGSIVNSSIVASDLKIESKNKAFFKKEKNTIYSTSNMIAKNNISVKNNISKTTQSIPASDLKSSSTKPAISYTIEKKNYININSINKKSFFINKTTNSIALLNSAFILGDYSDCYSFGSSFRLDWFLGVEIGVLKPFKSLSNSSIESADIYNIRNSNEKPLEGLQATVFTKVIKNNIPFYLKLGLKYTRLTDRLKYKYSYTDHDTIQGIISITESENGDTLTIIRGDIIRDIEIERNITQHYYFHQFDIPLSIGFRYGFTGIGIEAEVGTMFNIRTYTTGKIMNKLNTITPTKDVKMFKKSLGFSYFAGINIVKEISYKGEIFTGFRFRYFPNTFSLKNNPIKQKYNLVGFHLGYLYRL